MPARYTSRWTGSFSTSQSTGAGGRNLEPATPVRNPQPIDEIRALARQYRSKQWKAFRADALAIAENTCQRCHRRGEKGIVLQVHHILYVKGLLPWAYPLEACLVLCKGCHAREHGIIMPFSDWDDLGQIEDLGEPNGNCELCGTEIRFVHTVSHLRWGELEVGCDCADMLTNLTVATERQKDFQATIEKRKRFVSSPRWFTHPAGYTAIIQDYHELAVVQEGKEYLLLIYGKRGNLKFPTLLLAKAGLFDWLQLDKSQTWLLKRREQFRREQRKRRSRYVF